MKYSVLAKEVGEVIKLALLSIESLHIYDDKCSNSKIIINRGMRMVLIGFGRGVRDEG